MLIIEWKMERAKKRQADSRTRAHGGGRRELQGPVVVGAKHQRHKRDRAISRSQDGCDGRSARVANRGRLDSRKLTHSRRRPLLGTRAPPASRYVLLHCTCLCLPGSGLRVRLGPWRRREATPVGAGRP
ncbi:unnamed protein product [Urochloa decumbens]|uniref:Uncharacterized protein n=1 Tax=Urochloa decumbens TaxID=240449 RepID=A0ABC8V7P4_9POAL